MSAERYAETLRSILAASSAEVASRLVRFQAAAADAAVEGILVEVFIDQDAEGPFDVWARFDGDDAFMLDRRFDDARHLFGVEWNDVGWEPDVPARPRGWTREDLEQAVITSVTEWITPLFPHDAPNGLWQIGSSPYC